MRLPKFCVFKKVKEKFSCLHQYSFVSVELRQICYHVLLKICVEVVIAKRNPPKSLLGPFRFRSRRDCCLKRWKGSIVCMQLNRSFQVRPAQVCLISSSQIFFVRRVFLPEKCRQITQVGVQMVVTVCRCVWRQSVS